MASTEKRDPEVVQSTVPVASMPEEKKNLKDVDDAMLFVQEHDLERVTPEEDAALLRKIDRIFMPLVGILIFEQGSHW